MPPLTSVPAEILYSQQDNLSNALYAEDESTALAQILKTIEKQSSESPNDPRNLFLIVFLSIIFFLVTPLICMLIYQSERKQVMFEYMV